MTSISELYPIEMNQLQQQRSSFCLSDYEKYTLENPLGRTTCTGQVVMPVSQTERNH
jgi:hypothetical protein